MLATAAAVAVAAIAIVTLGRSHTNRVSAPGGPALVPAGARELVSELTVLRAPQSAVDRLPAYVIRRLDSGPFGRLVPSLTRFVATLPGAQAGPLRVYLIVRTPGRFDPRLTARNPLRGWDPRLGDQVSLVPITRSGTSLGEEGVPASVMNDTRSFEGESTYSVLYLSEIVPDGVARVRWEFAPHAGKTKHRRTLTINPPVHRNVAIAPNNGGGFLASVTWYSVDGRIIKHKAGMQLQGIPCAC